MEWNDLNGMEWNGMEWNEWNEPLSLTGPLSYQHAYGCEYLQYTLLQVVLAS